MQALLIQRHSCAYTNQLQCVDVRDPMLHAQAMVHELDQVLVPEFLWADSGANQVVYHMGDGSGSHIPLTNFTLVMPGGNGSQASTDPNNPMYQITEAGLMFSVVSAPD